MSDKTVFLSYRRDSTGKMFARSIKQELTHRGYDVFFDVDTVDAGHWESQILTNVIKSSHFILALTPNALSLCSYTNDWLRREFEFAVKHNRNIVPVCEESVEITDVKKNCPKCMKSIFNYQIAEIRHSSFENDIGTLVNRFILNSISHNNIMFDKNSFTQDISKIGCQSLPTTNQVQLLNNCEDVGIVNLFKKVTGCGRDERLEELVNNELRSSKKFRLLAKSGKSYLSGGKLWNHANFANLIGHKKAELEVVLESPFSHLGITHAIANCKQISFWEEDNKLNNLITSLQYSPNLSIRVTELSANCSLFLTSTEVIYDFYLWGRPNNYVSTENHFPAIEFNRISDAENDCYNLLEKHYSFLKSNSIPIEHFLFKPTNNDKIPIGVDFYNKYLQSPDKYLNKYREMESDFHDRINNYLNNLNKCNE